MLSNHSFRLIPILGRATQRTRGIRSLMSPAFKRFKQREVTRSTAKAEAATTLSLPTSYEEMDNNTLLTVAALENHEARIEVLKRHIMSRENCSYGEATNIFADIAAKNREGMALAALPYQIGIATGVTAAIASIPLVFDLNTTLWFNEFYVTTDIPPNEDLETGLEVGSWAWNWMEPPLGTMSFVLLSLQFSRAQMDNLGIKPYTSILKKRRGRALAEAFPRYDKKIIMDFSVTDPLVKMKS